MISLIEKQYRIIIFSLSGRVLVSGHRYSQELEDVIYDNEITEGTADDLENKDSQESLLLMNEIANSYLSLSMI